MICIILYIILAAAAVFGLCVGAERFAGWMRGCDLPWPVICGILWPVAGPVAAAYIAAKWFVDNH